MCSFGIGALSHVFIADGKGKTVRRFRAPQSLLLYYYFIHRDFELIKLQTWFPLQIQVYVNGHEWLARKLKQNGIRYTKRENAFLWIEDLARAQKFADRFCSLNWLRLLNHYAKACSCDYALS